MTQYRAYLRTKSGMYAQYDGYVDVVAEDRDQAQEKAIDKLRRTSFPDYSRSMWKIERVEAI